MPCCQAIYIEKVCIVLNKNEPQLVMNVYPVHERSGIIYQSISLESYYD